MATRSTQPENFDSTAKLMLEALAKASAELEKSVTAFTEQLISFNEGIQKSLEEELRAVHGRLESCVRNNLDELGHNKHLMMKRLLDAERAELDSLSDAGRQVRASLNQNAQQIEEKVQSFIEQQIQELKDFLHEPEQQINSVTSERRQQLTDRQNEAGVQIALKQEEFRQQLCTKVSALESQIQEEAKKSREAIVAASQSWISTIAAEREAHAGEFDTSADQTLTELDRAQAEGLVTIEQTEKQDIAVLDEVGSEWRKQISGHSDSFHRLIGNLGAVLRENFETKLANAAEQARQEISNLSDHAHEKISVTRTELEVELRSLEKDYIHQLETALRKLEAMVSEHANDKRNSGVARQHKAQKLRDQMQNHLKRFGASLVDSIKDAASALENDFDRATDGFHLRIEGARTSAIELLERESKLMQKDIDRTLKEFQRELGEEETQINKIEHAGQDAVVTVIACRKAMLSFKGE